MMAPEIYDTRRCHLGEGPLWHPGRRQIFWFDIEAKKLLSRTASGPLEWQFDEHVSAAGWIDDNRLLIASESGLYDFDIATGESRLVVAVEMDTPETRSNDGRADPQGGFWFGTMGKKGEAGAGALYRYHRGVLRRLVDRMTTPNTICFSPDGRYAYYADSQVGAVMRHELDADGWLVGAARPFIDFAASDSIPDGAVVDREGRLWIAIWNAGTVVCCNARGEIVETRALPARNVTCPAFGGDDLSVRFFKTAWGWNRQDPDGLTYTLHPGTVGRAEPAIRLG